jgi:hypothetical protein
MSMRMAGRVEVSAGAGGVGRATVTFVVDMETMHTRSQTSDSGTDQDAIALLDKTDDSSCGITFGRL